jgi:hypothetical protein
MDHFIEQYKAQFKKRRFDQPGDRVFVVRGKPAYVVETGAPGQVRLILKHEGVLLYTERFDDVEAALDFAETYYDQVAWVA